MKSARNIMPLLLASLIFLLGSCKVRTPKGVISSGKMENILYDYHEAQAMAQNTEKPNYYTEVYTEAVLQKHGVSRESFNKSLEYYSRHADLLYDIYEKLNKRYQNEIQAMGGNLDNAGINYAALSSKGDTANIWTGKTYGLLLPKLGKNLLAFSMTADTSFKPKDKFEWHITTQFIYKEGRKTAECVIAVRYENDSVATMQQPIYGDGENVITLQASKMPIKKVEGFIYIDEPWNETVKLLFLSKITLVRFHSQEAKETEKPLPADSTANEQENAKKAFIDSIQRTTKEENKGDHFRTVTRGRAIPHQKE